MYSFVIKLAKDVRRAVELVNTIPMLVLINDIVEVVLVDPDPNKVSVTINNTFFFFRIYVSSYKIIINFKRFIKFFHGHAFPFVISDFLFNHFLSLSLKIVVQFLYQDRPIINRKYHSKKFSATYSSNILTQYNFSRASFLLYLFHDQ